MSFGTYGTVKPAFITEEDVEVWYYYRPTRNSEDNSFSNGFKRLDSTYTVFETTKMGSGNLPSDILPGMYNLKLPVDVFGRKGFYTVYLKPREILCTIEDVGVLSAYPDIKGIILNMESTELRAQSSNLLENGKLIGYRVEFFDDGERQDYYRIITSNNKVEPVVQNLNNSGQKGDRFYRYNDSSNLTFLTLTPSTATDFKSNAIPYIGKTGQQIVLVNTKFNPQMIEIEMVDHDIETLSYMLEGNQIRGLDNGLITTYNENNEIYHQSENYSVKDRATGNPVFEVKENKKNNIDFTQDFNTITQE